MRLPSAERGRLKAIGLLLLAVALAYLVLLHWWWTAPMLSMGDRMQELRAEELHMRMLAQQQPAIEQRLAAVRSSEAANPGFLPEATTELASAGLVQRMESQLDAISPGHASCNITQRTPVPSTISERYQRVVLQVRMLCGMSEFNGLLHAFEGGRPQLFVNNLNIISRRGFVSDTGALDTSAPLDITFDLSGYLRPGIGGGNAKQD